LGIVDQFSAPRTIIRLGVSIERAQAQLPTSKMIEALRDNL
jgi:hypothetical protein